MKWLTYREDINTGKIYEFDIFHHASYLEEVQDLKASNLDYETFQRRLRSITMYYFWSKCEHEVVVTSWPVYIDKQEKERLEAEDTRKYRYMISPTVGRKISVYDQIVLNWDVFAQYVYIHN